MHNNTILMDLGQDIKCKKVDSSIPVMCLVETYIDLTWEIPAMRSQLWHILGEMA